MENFQVNINVFKPFNKKENFMKKNRKTYLLVFSLEKVVTKLFEKYSKYM